MAPGQVTDPSTAERYEALIRISNSIRAGKQPQDLFEVLVHELRSVIPFDAIAQFDQCVKKMHWHVGPARQPDEGCPSEGETGESLPEFVYRTQETVLLGNVESEKRFPAFTRKMQKAGLKSLYAFPLTTAHRRIGSLMIASTQPDAYSPEQVRFCSLVADQIALANDDAINFQASQKAHRTTATIARPDESGRLHSESARRSAGDFGTGSPCHAL